MPTHRATAENILYAVNLVVSALIVYALYRMLANAFRAPGGPGSTAILVLTYVVIIVVYVFFAKGILIGRFRGNGVRVSANQFHEIYRIYRSQLETLGIKREPALYCVQSNGVLNAFATRMMFRNYIVMYSEILEAAYEEGEHAVSFILAHELTHIKRGHLVKNLFIWPAIVLFPLRLAYSRACEYTCDWVGRSVTSAAGLQGLVILAAGRKLSARVSIGPYLAAAGAERGFWVWCAEFLSTHPNLPKRIRRLWDGQAQMTQ